MLIFRPSEIKCFKYNVQSVMGMFCHLVYSNVYFYFAKQPKMYSVLLCSVPFKFPEELFSKQTFQNECDSSMECLHCAWSISSPVVILNYRVIYLSYTPSPIIFTKAVTGRGCIIFCESKLQFEFIPKPIYLVFWSRSTQEKVPWF